MKQGPLTAMDVIEKVTGEMKVHTAAIASRHPARLDAGMARRKAPGPARDVGDVLLPPRSDFTMAGDLLVFVDEIRSRRWSATWQAAGVLEGSKMDGLQHAAPPTT